MKLFKYILLALFLLLIAGCATVEQRTDAKRETVIDRIYSKPKEIAWEVPYVTSWCDKLKLKRGYVDVNGCQIYYEEEGKGIPIILLNPGPGCTHQAFHPHFGKAADFSRVIYYDPRGVGKSDYKPGEEGYIVEQAIADLEALRKSLNIDKWIVMGGLMAAV